MKYLDKDNKRMQDKINSENEERKKKEEEMKRRLQEAQEVDITSSLETDKYFFFILGK